MMLAFFIVLFSIERLDNASMGVDFGGNDPYTCDITQDGVKVGEFAMEPKSALIDISFEKKDDLSRNSLLPQTG